MATTPTKEAALVRVIAKASKMLAETGSSLQAPIGKAVWDRLLEVVAEEQGSGVPQILETEVACSRLDIGADGHSVVYHFDIREYAKTRRQRQ